MKSVQLKKKYLPPDEMKGLINKLNRNMFGDDLWINNLIRLEKSVIRGETLEGSSDNTPRKTFSRLKLPGRLKIDMQLPGTSTERHHSSKHIKRKLLSPLKLNEFSDCLVYESSSGKLVCPRRPDIEQTYDSNKYLPPTIQVTLQKFRRRTDKKRPSISSRRIQQKQSVERLYKSPRRTDLTSSELKNRYNPLFD